MNPYFQIHYGNWNSFKLWNESLLGSSESPDEITNFENLFKYVHQELF